MLNCGEALELISAELDGELTPQQKAALEKHLNSCPTCRDLQRDLEAIHRELADIAAAPVPPPVDLQPAIMAQIRAEGHPIPQKKPGWKLRLAVAAVFAAVLLGAGAQHFWQGGTGTESSAESGTALMADGDTAAFSGTAGGGAPVFGSDAGLEQKQSLQSPQAAPQTAVSPEDSPPIIACRSAEAAQEEVEKEVSASRNFNELKENQMEDQNAGLELCGILTLSWEDAGPLEGLDYVQQDGVRRYLVSADTFETLIQAQPNLTSDTTILEGDGISSGAEHGLVLVVGAPEENS